MNRLVDTSYPIVCFGEILWDVLPNCAVPGGAPMNVTYHLKKLGIDPGLITRVGSDDWGKNLIGLMQKNFIGTDFFQIDTTLETGKVNATICENNEMSYEILMPVAWDNIQWDDRFADLIPYSTYFVFGSLAMRSKISRNTLFQLLEIANKKVVDINLRPPHYTNEVIDRLLSEANLLKLNSNELEIITGGISAKKSERDRIKQLQDVHHIETIVVTKGEEGAILYKDNFFYEHKGFHVKVKDTVGSGDAFLAGLLAKFLAGEDPEDALEFACGLGAFIASCTGACPDYAVSDIIKLFSKNQTILNHL